MTPGFWLLNSLIGTVGFTILIGSASALAIVLRDKRRPREPLVQETTDVGPRFFSRYEVPE